MDFTKEQTKEIHRRVKRLIIDKRMKMAEFYKKSGVSSSLFSQYNTGKVTATNLTVSKMAFALDVNIADLLDGIENNEKNARQQETDGLTDMQKQLIQLTQDFSEQDFSVLLSTAQALKASRIPHRQDS